MRAQRTPAPRAAEARPTGRGRRPERVLVAVLALAAVVAAAWLAVVGRRAVTAATPAGPGESWPPPGAAGDGSGAPGGRGAAEGRAAAQGPDPADGTEPADSPGATSPADSPGSTSPADSPDASGSTASTGSPDFSGSAAPSDSPDSSSAVDQLSRVSGLGRRSAEALVAGGVTGLADLAGRSDDELAAVLDSAGVRRSTTLATWPSQARRLLEG